MIHVAVMHHEPTEDGQTEQVYVSLDGETYLPVNRRPESGDEAEIAKLFEVPREGKNVTIPMRWARNALRVSWWPESVGVKSFDHYTV